MNLNQADNALLNYRRIKFGKIGIQAEENKIVIDHYAVQKKQ